MAQQFAKTVNVLKFDENEAYDHDRPISSLVRTQLLHLHQAEHIGVPEKARTNININDLHTEREASEYIAKVTRLLHKHGNAAGKKSKVRKPARKRPAGKSAKKTAAKKSATKNRKSRK
jgi:hypothetical protein